MDAYTGYQGDRGKDFVVSQNFSKQVVFQIWVEKFSDVLAQASQPGQGYSPVWYHSQSNRYWAPVGFASSLSHSFSNAISSAAVNPVSSSGGGGGGSSGGGGSGGGGGW